MIITHLYYNKDLTDNIYITIILYYIYYYIRRILYFVKLLTIHKIVNNFTKIHNFENLLFRNNMLVKIFECNMFNFIVYFYCNYIV